MRLDLGLHVGGRILSLGIVGVVLVFISALMLCYNPLEVILKKFLTLSPGTLFFTLWAIPPYDVTMKLYIFNVTNADAFFRGEELLKVNQVGPYSYKEMLSNNNATFNDDGTVTFKPFREFRPDPENSVGDPKVDRIIVPNIPLIGIQSFLKDSSLMTNIAFSTLTTTLGTKSFLNLTIEEYLWGYEDKLVGLGNQFIPSWIDFGKFGILERLMDRDNHNEVTISVNPGQRPSDYKQILTEEELMSQYHIVDWNGLPGLKEWGFKGKNESDNRPKKCQLVEGAFDGTIFPRPMRKHRNVTIFRKAFCRPVPLEFIEENVTKGGFKSYIYKMGKDLFASPEINPYNECFCFDGICPGRGLQSIAPCYYDLPIVLSQPHFLNADPELLKTVEGLYPDEEKHASIAKIQPEIGIPMDGSTLKIQVNLGVGQTRFNYKTRPFNGLTVPLLWIELTCSELPPLVSWLLTLVLDILPVCQKVLCFVLLFSGIACAASCVLLILYFSKDVPRSLSIASEYTAIPLITLPAQFMREKEKEKELLISE